MATAYNQKGGNRPRILLKLCEARHVRDWLGVVTQVAKELDVFRSSVDSTHQQYGGVINLCQSLHEENRNLKALVEYYRERVQTPAERLEAFQPLPSRSEWDEADRKSLAAMKKLGLLDTK